MSSNAPPSLRLLSYALAFSALAFAIAAFYSQVLPEPRWFWAAVIHTPIALLVLWKGSGNPSEGLGPPWLKRLAYWSGPLLFALLALLSGLSQLLSPETPAGSPLVFEPYLLATLLWIPIVEECIFRGGVGRWLRQRLGDGWGMYVSALFFATLHSAPPQNWIPPLGPFLLAMACELIVRITGRLTPAILLHVCCNASPLLFTLLDPRWLRWLGTLYLDL